MSGLTPELTLLRDILERFPQADPASEFYNEEINGCEAVNYISELVPELRTMLDAEHPPVPDGILETLRAAWSFIEDVTDDDPERSEKFFALRSRVRTVFWNLDEPQSSAHLGGLQTSWNYHDHGAHQFYNLADWRTSVAASDTVLGYQTWVEHQLEELLSGIYLDGVDAIEVAGCTEVDGVVDVIIESDAEFFSVYTHKQGEGVECVCDFNTKAQAAEFAAVLAKRGGIPVYGNLCVV